MTVIRNVILPITRVTSHRESTTDSAIWYSVACATVLAFAAVLRFCRLDVSLFEDEIWVAALARHGGWHAHSYSTPPLFYAIERMWAALRGTDPARLREPAAFFGVALAAVPLFANRARATGLIWSMLLAFSSPLLFYSGRIKQYTLEAFVAAALIVLLLHALESNATIAWFAFFGLALVGVTTLYSPIFVVGAAALVAVPPAPRRALPFALVFAAFVAAYLGYLAPGPESIALHGDMNVFFARNGRWVTSPSSFLSNTLHFAGQAMNLVRGGWIAGMLAAIVCLFRRIDRMVTVLAFAPLVAVAAASVRHYYPYGEVRLMIFALPALYLVFASAFSYAAARTKLIGGLLAGAFLFAFIWNGVGRETYNSTYMYVFELRPLYDFVAANHRDGETIFAVSSLAAPLRYYHPDLGRAVVLWDSGRVAASGWYVAFTKPPGGEVVLHVQNAWASRITLPPAAGGSAPPAVATANTVRSTETR